jgi:UDP-N-acetylglucosamine 2-epimerase (non-hydrolysing)
MKLLHVVGARPNFPKLAPVYRAACGAALDQVIVHTGQHYSDALSGEFFRDLDLPAPDLNLGVGSGTHAAQTAATMLGLEPVLLRERPHWVVVYGDVNSTVAAALVASKLGLRIAHVEAGLRSGDRAMPEEINRIVTDRLADLLLTPSHDADDTLRREGEPEEEIRFVGNVMVDSLYHAVARLEALGRLSTPDGPAPVVVTLHRPSNVDQPARLAAIIESLRMIAEERPVVFPAHPRTCERLTRVGLELGAVQVVEPAGYLDMVALIHGAWAVVTDSGGLQEETTVLGIPCFTVRDTTERPITVWQGTNRLVPDPGGLLEAVRNARRVAVPPRIEGWDGNAGTRIVSELMRAPRP